MGNKLQNNEPIITAESALPTTKAKGNCRAPTIANFFCRDEGIALIAVELIRQFT